MVSSFPPLRFVDSATELDLFLLTGQKTTAYFPAPHLRFISRRNHFLVHSSDRSGSIQAYHLDWKSGESVQLTEAAALDPATLALAADERSLYFFEGRDLKQLTLPKLKDRVVTSIPAGWDRAPGFALSSDSSRAVWVERPAGQPAGPHRIRAITTLRGAPATVIEQPGPVSDPQLRPGAASSQVLYRMGGQLRLVNLDGSHDHALPLDPAGKPGQALWSPNGETVLYLSQPVDPKQLITIREYTLADNTDRLVSRTSQFESFGANSDTSVFVGATRGKAAAYIVLLVRMARRELTLCEHRSSNAATVSPVFSPDSQSIFFLSDRTGKPAIYRIHVERFVEETE